MRILISVTLIVLLVNISAARRCYEGYATRYHASMTEKECSAGSETCVEVFAYIHVAHGDPEERYLYGCGSCEGTEFEDGIEMISCNDCSYDLCNFDDHINGASNLSVVMSMLVSTIYYMLCI